MTRRRRRHGTSSALPLAVNVPTAIGEKMWSPAYCSPHGPATCRAYSKPNQVSVPSFVNTGQNEITWAYGVRTVLQLDRLRLREYLPRTMESLYRAGFTKPWLFVDGAMDYYHYERFGCPLTTRYPAIGVTGNFLLSLHELILRFPSADRYALFEDDLVMCRNVRHYLDQTPYRPGVYWNLYTCAGYQAVCPPWREGHGKEGFYRPPQAGQGAVALVFDRTAVASLMSSKCLSEAVLERRGTQAIDGLVAMVLNHAGIREWVHTPSLVQHTGEISSFGNHPHPHATSFLGEEFDALTLTH